MTTLRDLMANPLTSPYTIDIVEPNLAQAATRRRKRIGSLPLVANVLTLQSLVPTDQPAKLALIADAANILARRWRAARPAPVTPADLRLAARMPPAGLTRAAAKLPPDSPLAQVAADLRPLPRGPTPR